MSISIGTIILAILVLNYLVKISVIFATIFATMRKLKQICPQSILMMIYNILSLPNLNYAIRL